MSSTPQSTNNHRVIHFIDIKCKSSEEVIKSRDFLRFFKECLDIYDFENGKNIYCIYEKLLNSGKISLSDAEVIYDLLNSEDFLKICSDYYDTGNIQFSFNSSQINNIEHLKLSNIIKSLKKYISLSAIFSDTTEIVNSIVNSDLETPQKFLGVNIYLFEEKIVINNYIDGKGFILLNGEGEQISLEGEFYEDIDLTHYNYSGLIVVKNSDGYFLLNGKGELITPKGENYIDIDFSQYSKTGLIIAENNNGKVLFNKYGTQISPEGRYFKHFILSEYIETGLISALEDLGKVLFNKEGVQITPEGRYYNDFIMRYFSSTGLFIAIDNENNNIVFDINGREILKTNKKIFLDENNNKLYYLEYKYLKKYIEI